MQKPISKLAIVIPAYKIEYLYQAINSIINQTCKDFTLYVGDDAGPIEIETIINQYLKSHTIVYKKFENNLGRTNLIAHWTRCIEMIGGEEWIWLFSDDDIMAPNCVEMFYKTLENNSDFDLYRFKIKQIDECNNELISGGFNKDILTVEELLVGRLNSSIQTTVIEYIFRKTKFDEVGGFQFFDLAWGSDDATWIKIGKAKGIKAINNEAFVCWRRSTQNISTTKNPDIIFRKMNARIDFSSWILDLVNNKKLNLHHGLIVKLITKWFSRFLVSSIPILKFSQIIKLSNKFDNAVQVSLFCSIINFLLLIYYKLKWYIKLLIKS